MRKHDYRQLRRLVTRLAFGKRFLMRVSKYFFVL